MNKKCDEPRVREIVKEELELNSCNEPMVKKIVERWHSNNLASDSANIVLQILQSQGSSTASVDFELYLVLRDILNRETITYVIIKSKLGKSDTQQSRSI
jgi:hypothetical protein